MGHCGKFVYAHWVTAWDETINICKTLHTMGRGAVFSYTLWTIAQNKLPENRTTNFLKQLAKFFFKETLWLQSAHI
jgi:hypothetical protein